MKKKIFAVLLAICAVIACGESVFAQEDLVNCSIGNTGGDTPKEYCAGSLYRRNRSRLANDCRSSITANDYACETDIKEHLVCSSSIPAGECTNRLNSYASEIRKLIQNDNVDPCEGAGQYRDSCIKGATNWKWYFAKDPNSDGGGGGGGTGLADSNSDICNNKYIDKNSAAYKMYCSTGDEDSARSVVIKVLETVFTWSGIIAVIVVIIGGVFYMTSEGDPGKVAKAKNAIFYAIIGLIVSLSAFAIVHFVLSRIGM